MPYITQEERETINPKLKEFLMFMGPMTPGQFVYVMYEMGLWQVSNGGVDSVPVGWTKCNEVMGNYDCCAKEFYRRVVGPYEDTAIARNGDCNPPRANRKPYLKINQEIGWTNGLNGKIDPFDTPGCP